MVKTSSLFLAGLALAEGTGPAWPNLPVQWLTQPCDHFNAKSDCTFQHKYFVDASQWKGPDNPDAMITFIPGGEAAMGMMYDYRILRELALDRGGIVLTMEHRFFGDSLPLAKNKSLIESMGTLSVEQAMADYTNIISIVREQYKCPHCPVVAGGGSYSGKLSAYMRLKYPHIVDMALAASAPVFLDSPGFGDETDYFKVVTDAVRKLSPECPDYVRGMINTIINTDTQTLSKELDLCTPLPNDYQKGTLQLMQRVMNQFADTSMGNYPPARSPVAAECANLLSQPKGSLAGIKAFLSDRYKFDKATGLAVSEPLEAGACYNFTNAVAAGPKGEVVCSDWSGCGGGQNAEIWDYEACAEVVQPLSSTNVTDMFWPRKWTEEWNAKHCMERFGATPLRGGRQLAHTMGLDFLHAGLVGGYSRVIFSNGLQDPWSAGGVKQNLSSDVIAIVMPNGSHHVDLRGPDPDDTPDVLEGRAEERRILTGWLAQAAKDRIALKGRRLA